MKTDVTQGVIFSILMIFLSGCTSLYQENILSDKKDNEINTKKAVVKLIEENRQMKQELQNHHEKILELYALFNHHEGKTQQQLKLSTDTLDVFQVVAQRANVRYAASLKAPIAKVLNRGNRVRVLEQGGDKNTWCKIELEGEHLWIYAQNIEKYNGN